MFFFNFHFAKSPGKSRQDLLFCVTEGRFLFVCLPILSQGLQPMKNLSYANVFASCTWLSSTPEEPPHSLRLHQVPWAYYKVKQCGHKGLTVYSSMSVDYCLWQPRECVKSLFCSPHLSGYVQVWEPLSFKDNWGFQHMHNRTPSESLWSQTWALLWTHWRILTLWQGIQSPPLPNKSVPDLPPSSGQCVLTNRNQIFINQIKCD